MTSLVVNPSRLATLLEALDGAALCFVVGETQNLVGNSRSAALLTRLFDAPTTPANVAVLANGTTLHVFAKSGKVSGATVLTSVEAFVAQVTAVAPTLHVFSKELDKQSGAWATVLLASLSSFTASAKDGAAIAARCLAVKDATEKENVRKAGAVTAFAFKRYAIDRLKAALANPTPPSEAALAEDFDYVLNHPKKIPELDKMDDAHFEAAFSPSAVQSNPNNFRLQLREAISGTENSHASVRGPCVTLAMGAKHRGYAVLCARTFLVQPCPAPLIEAYNFLHAVFEHLLSLLVKGSPLKDIHSAVMAFAQRTNASLAAKLVPELGFTTGLHFGDPRGTISPRAESAVQNGTVLVLRVALQGVAANVVKTEDGDQEEQFGLVIADTVIFDNDAVKAATKVDRAPAAITWSPIEVKAEVKKEKEPEVYVPRVTRGAAAAVGLDLEAARKDKIRELLRQKREAWVAAGSPQGVDAANTTEDNSAIGRLSRGAAQCYGSAGIPAEFASKGLSVDRARQALIVPIGGDLVPFHVSTITKATCIPDGKGKTVMTVTFATTQASNVAFARQRNRQWVKELTFVRPDGGFLFDIVAAITEVQKMIKESDAKSKQNSGVAPTEALKLVPGAVRLPTVKMRPAPAQVSKGGSITGNLEAHGNGFRFAFGGQHIDIPYSNIKHFIFQPARKEIVVVLHINLRQPMIIAGKKTEDVQFIAEVLETSVAVGGSRKTHDEELEAEERDNQRVRETNKQFGTFAKKVAEDHGLTLELPIAGESSRFQGVANKKMTWFNVNEHAMWSVSEMPFCVISLDDIEVVALERVLPSQHNFDAMFIHKDYKTVVPVTNIAMIHLEAFKDWLGELGKVVYFESTANIAWTKILKTLRDDKEWEAWGPGGWITYVDPNAGDEEGGDDSDPDDADSDYEEDEESDEDSDDSEEDSEWAEEGSSSDFDSDDSGDSEGSWSSVERKAEVADRKRGYNSDDSDRPKRPRGAGPQVAQRKPPQPAPPRR